MKKIIFAVITVLLYSCHCYTTYTIGISNQTNDTISVYFSGTSAYTQGVDSVIIYPHIDVIYFNWTGTAPCQGTINCYTGINKNEVNVKTSSGKVLKKDIVCLDNWICRRGNYTEGLDMTFVITEDDLE